ncbi:hypothetical protein [Fusibacter bizertensis]
MNIKAKLSLPMVLKILILVVAVGGIVFSFYIHVAKTEKSAEKIANQFLIALYDATPETLSKILPSNDEYSDSQDDNFKHYIKALNHAIRKRFGNCYTDEFWNYMIGNRMWLTAPTAAQKRTCNIEVKNVTFNRINPDEKEVHLNFEVEMEMTNCKDHNVMPVVQKGEVWLVFEDLKYKVNQLIYLDNQLVQYTY